MKKKYADEFMPQSAKPESGSAEANAAASLWLSLFKAILGFFRADPWRLRAAAAMPRGALQTPYTVCHRNAPGGTRTSDLRFRRLHRFLGGPDHLFDPRSPISRTSLAAGRFDEGEKMPSSTREYRRGGSPAGLYTFRRRHALARPRRRLGSGLPIPLARAWGSPNSPGSPRPVSGSGPYLSSAAADRQPRKPPLYPAELRARPPILTPQRPPSPAPPTRGPLRLHFTLSGSAPEA